MENKKINSFQQTELSIREPDTQSPNDGLLNNIKQNIFKWHRTIGLITITPVIFWCLSGLMHPFLSHWFKPEIARQVLETKVVDQQKTEISIQDVLTKSHIDEFKSFRFVEWNGKTYYQVKLVDDEIRYYDTSHGNEIKNGDKLYAEFLARYFLDDQKSILKSIKLQTEFDQQYKYVNRLLPVWKVSFNRADEMDVYVETSSSRLGTFNTTSRKVFLWAFDNFHNWSFINRVTNNTTRVTIMVIMLSVISLSALSGLLIYGLFWRRFGKLTNTHQKKGLRKYHRQIGIATAFITLTFGFSGGFHATRKLEPNRLPEMIFDPIIRVNDLQTSSLSLSIDDERFQNLSVVKKGKEYFFQVFYGDSEDKASETIYLNANDGSVWKNGDNEYAQYLGKKFLAALSDEKGLSGECCEEMGERRI
ncbi:MAG: PepSY domain-containing protein, partial [Cyclobacteriaceae bacterium]|nr:PepSY domain-containing protein [Cyclobacteriaceae bacterium]